LGLSRYWYNQAIEHLKQPDTKASLYDVRLIQDNEHPEWAFDCPQRIREHSINEACRAVRNAKRKYAIAHQFQQVKFRSRKDVVQRFGFDRQSLNKDFVFKGKNKVLFKASEEFNSELEGTKVVKENGRWFLILPQKRSIKTPDNQRLGAVALDPGVRTFVSYYSETHHGKIGEGDFNRIFRLCLCLDNMMSRICLSKGKRRNSIRKAAERLRWKIRDLIDDLHHKTANFLVRNFDIVFLPTFETQRMVSKLRHKTARMMLTFAHFRFKSFLKAKGEEYSCEVIDVSEAYTSKTCSYCGKIHNIGSRKVMRCGCRAAVDRDLNGARGIYLRALRAPSVSADSRNATVLSDLHNFE
jgi:putative transposase